MIIRKEKAMSLLFFLCAKLYLPIRNVSYTETKHDANIH